MCPLFPAQFLTAKFPLCQYPRHQCPGEVLTAEETVAAGSVYFQQVIEFLQDGDIQGAATKIDHDKGAFVPLLAQPIRQGSGRWLVYQAFNVQAGKPCCSERSGTLVIVEVGRDTDDGFFDVFPEKGFCIGFDLLENQR